MPDFTFREKLGEGKFGEVWLADDNAVDAVRAVKIINEEFIAEGSDFYLEPKTLAKLSSKYIVQVFDAGRQADGKLYISMEYLPQGSYDDMLKSQERVKLRQAIRAICDVLRALEYAHDEGYVHRDVKPGNIMLADGQAKLSDFGLATKLTDIDQTESKGYTAYLAPEIIRENASSPISDVYAAGGSLYRMINGETFVRDQMQLRLQTLIIQGRFPRRDSYQHFVPTRLRQIINKALNVDPEKRYRNAQQFRSALEAIERKIVCDWEYESSLSAEVWRAHTDRYDVEALSPNKKSIKEEYEFIVKKTFASGITQHCKKHSASFSTIGQRAKHIHRVLSSMTEGGC